MSEKFIYLTARELNKLRKRQYEKQGFCCAVSGLPYELNECVVDHKHKLKSEEIGGPDRLGLCRGVIGKNINTFEGKIVRMYIRFGLREDIELPTLLRRLADYLENPPLEPKYVHPKERPKRKILNKMEYKRVCKYWFLMYPLNRVLPKYPGDKVETPKWKENIRKANEWRRLDIQKKLNEDQRKKISKAMELIKNGNSKPDRRRQKRHKTAGPSREQ